MLKPLNSHSTMYLLKPTCASIVINVIIFTFHHVSIKTFSVSGQLPMQEKFTFHHVSIKTILKTILHPPKNYSHSTMYLLKPSKIFANVFGITFTFHHVSIKTIYHTPKHRLALQFTFHHVSIKTVLLVITFTYNIHSHSTMYLLKHRHKPSNKTSYHIHIPPCIY